MVVLVKSGYHNYETIFMPSKLTTQCWLIFGKSVIENQISSSLSFRQYCLCSHSRANEPASHFYLDNASISKITFLTCLWLTCYDDNPLLTFPKLPSCISLKSESTRWERNCIRLKCIDFCTSNTIWSCVLKFS